MLKTFFALSTLVVLSGCVAVPAQRVDQPPAPVVYYPPPVYYYYPAPSFYFRWGGGGHRGHWR